MYVTSHYLTLQSCKMKQALLLSILGLGLLSSCTTAFKSGQTPDDVYYSPGREMVSNREDETKKAQQESYQQYQTNLDDQYLRMKISRRYRWSQIDDFGYWNDSRYDFGYNNYYNGIYSNIYSYPSIYIGNRGYYPFQGNYGWYSPVYTIIHYTNPKVSYNGTTSASNIYAYRNKNYNNNNYAFKDPKTGNFISGNNNNSFGNLIKKVFISGTNGNNSSSFDRPSRTFSPSNSNSSPAPSSSAGGSSGGFQSTGSSTSTGRGGKG